MRSSGGWHLARRKRGILATSVVIELLVFWAFAACILIIILTITISNRGVVRVIGVIVLAALLVVGLAQRLSNRGDPHPDGQRGKPASPGAAIAAVPLDEIKVDELKMSGSGAPFELRGSIHNASTDMRLQSLTLRIVRRDCFDGAIDPSGCVLIWQDQHWIKVDLAPQSERKFATSFYAHTNVPRARGTIKDEFKLVAATGQPQTP
jgi:hypothetical protein